MTRPVAVVILLAMLAAVALLAGFIAKASAHEAHSQMWTYPPGCCNSAATSPNGDCDVISGRYVKARTWGARSFREGVRAAACEIEVAA